MATMTQNVDLDNLSMDLSASQYDDKIAVSVRINDQLLDAQSINTGRAEQAAAVMTLFAAGTIGQREVNRFMKKINSK